MLGSKNSGVGQAMFDVKPVDESGSVDVQKIGAVQPTVNLASFRPKKQKFVRESQPQRQSVGAPTEFPRSVGIPTPGTKASEEEKFTSLSVPSTETLPPVIGLPSQQDIKEQFEELMGHDLDLGIELAKIGGNPPKFSEGKLKRAKPRYRIIRNHPSSIFAPEPACPDQDIGGLYAPLISDIHHSATTIAHEEYTPFAEGDDSNIKVEPILAFGPNKLSQSAETDVRSLFAIPSIQLITKKKSFPKFKVSKRYFVAVAVIIIGLAIIIGYGLHLKRQVVEQSTAAVTNLQTAQDGLKALDFKNASQDFFSAYANFSKAGDSLNVFGASITDILSALPGGGTLKSAKNLVQVGQLLSAAGTSMTTALDAVSKTGALSDFIVTKADASGRLSDQGVGVGPIVSALKKALLASQQQIVQASALMADIDGSIIPADKQAGFTDLKSKLPELEAGVNMSVDYAKFFENLINNGKAKYLVMFQNTSELRPTGGFPGTYGVVSFINGKMDNLFVDDVYNLDGQIKENIIPPLQMQHITPNWGMRDANWYVDFPTSARNIEKFYKKESGQNVNGVIVINPEMIQKILAIVGPIEMPDYKLTLDSKNVLTTIQSQVEYGPNRTQPKQILKDFAPLLMNKIYTAGSDKWLAIFNTLILSMNQRDVLMSFDNLSLESFVTDKGFGGQVHQGDADYLMVTISNIKGSKTDAVTDTLLAVDTKFENNDAIHTLTITRQHNGGGEKFGFYNKQNPAYVRVLVPDGAELISVAGNDQPNFAPLINYAQDKSFVRDDNLVKFENSGDPSTSSGQAGVTTYKESGKTEFGFWLITDAGKSKTVTVQYKVPKALTNKSYSLYIQKQPALKIKDFSFSMQKPDGLTPEASAPLLVQSGSTYSYSAPLKNDLTVKVNFK